MAKQKEMPHMNPESHLNLEESYLASRKVWWKQRWFRFNKWLLIVAVTSLILFDLLGAFLIPKDMGLGFSTMSFIYETRWLLLYALLANLLYSLGTFIDRIFNKDDSLKFRKRLFNLIFWFFVLFPFLLPLLFIILFMLGI